MEWNSLHDTKKKKLKKIKTAGWEGLEGERFRFCDFCQRYLPQNHALASVGSRYYVTYYCRIFATSSFEKY